MLTAPFDPVGENSWNRWSFDSYGTTYSRSATAMRDLEHQLGKTVLEKAFRDYYSRWKFRHPSVADFEQSLIESSGQQKPIKTVFDQVVYGAVKIDDAVDGVRSEEVLPLAGTREVNGKWVEETAGELQKRISKERADWKKAHPDSAIGPYPYQTVVSLVRYGAPTTETLLTKFADGSSETVVWDDDKNWKRFTWVKPYPAVSAELDPEQMHYLDANRLNNSMTVESDEETKQEKGAPKPPPAASAAARWTADLAYLFQSMVAAMTTL
jgi:hypothetical protein